MIIDAAELKRRYSLRIAGARDKQVYIGPKIVSLDISNSCGLKCQYCSAIHAPGDQAHSKEASFIPWERFLGVVRDCVDLNVDQLHITGSGEPTTHPLFRDMMRHLEKQPLYVKLFTNATFPLGHCSDVFKADHAAIHLSAVDRQEYRDLHGKDLFDRVVNNIERLVSLRDERKPGFRVQVTYIVNTVNIDQKQKMQELASRLGVDSIYFSKMKVFAYNREIALPEGSIDAVEIKTPPACLNGWFYMKVRLDGAISTCCQKGHMRCGDLGKRSVKQFWSSTHMMNRRVLGKYGRVLKAFKACQTCPSYDDNIQYLKDLAKAGRKA
jgi:pyruvate-formate lyase-activating enzyme